jgi:hypothetical protein
MPSSDIPILIPIEEVILDLQRLVVESFVICHIAFGNPSANGADRGIT